MTATRTSLRDMARAAMTKQLEAEAVAELVERRESGEMLRRIIRDRLDFTLDEAITGPKCEFEGIHFKAVFDGDDRSAAASWSLYAAMADGQTHGDWTRIESLADLGLLITEYD